MNNFIIDKMKSKTGILLKIDRKKSERYFPKKKKKKMMRKKYISMYLQRPLS